MELDSNVRSSLVMGHFSADSYWTGKSMISIAIRYKNTKLPEPVGRLQFVAFKNFQELVFIN